jgi:glucose/arabinose dehydrogenase
MGCKSEAQMTSRLVKDSLFIPWEIVYGPDNHIWFTQKNGYICRLDPATSKTDTLYHETNTYVTGEGGMLGLALDPNFSTQPYVYVSYNYNSGGTKERIVRYSYSGGVLQNPQTLIDNIAGASIHDGCRLLFIDGKLYITTGDAANQTLPQNLASLNGKVLRINPDGTIPSDNPIPGNPAWSWGHRNAQGMIYANNKLYITEHGPTNDDEINVIEKGRNYGWPNVHGFCDASEQQFCNDSNVVEPLKVWTPTLAVCGLDYYDHPMFPTLQKSLLMTTLKDQKLYQLKLNGTFDAITTTTIVSGVSVGRIRDICISPNGRIYISTSNSNSSGSNRIDKIIELYDPNFNNINNPGVKEKNITVYPNPTSGELIVGIKNMPLNKIFDYKISTLDGRIILAGKLQRGNNAIDLKAVPMATYNVQVADGNTVLHSEKIIKQ